MLESERTLFKNGSDKASTKIKKSKSLSHSKILEIETRRSMTIERETEIGVKEEVEGTEEMETIGKEVKEDKGEREDKGDKEDSVEEEAGETTMVKVETKKVDNVEEETTDKADKRRKRCMLTRQLEKHLQTSKNANRD